MQGVCISKRRFEYGQNTRCKVSVFLREGLKMVKILDRLTVSLNFKNTLKTATAHPNQTKPRSTGPFKTGRCNFTVWGCNYHEGGGRMRGGDLEDCVFCTQQLYLFRRGNATNIGFGKMQMKLFSVSCL